jgi:hypothetical protein
MIFSEKNGNNEKVLTTFGGLIMEVTIPQLLLGSAFQKQRLYSSA